MDAVAQRTLTTAAHDMPAGPRLCRRCIPPVGHWATEAESLRQAMLGLMAEPKYAHPAYWAPFALVGDGAR